MLFMRCDFSLEVGGWRRWLVDIMAGPVAFDPWADPSPAERKCVAAFVFNESTCSDIVAMRGRIRVQNQRSY